MEYYLYDYIFKFFWLSIGLILLAWMDFINFQRPKDSGYFSLHTKGSKNDAWHHGKKLAILSFGIAAIGYDQVIYLLLNPYIWLAILAFIIQVFIYNFLLKMIKRIFRIK